MSLRKITILTCIPFFVLGIIATLIGWHCYETDLRNKQALYLKLTGQDITKQEARYINFNIVPK